MTVQHRRQAGAEGSTSLVQTCQGVFSLADLHLELQQLGLWSPSLDSPLHHWLELLQKIQIVSGDRDVPRQECQVHLPPSRTDAQVELLGVP